MLCAGSDSLDDLMGGSPPPRLICWLFWSLAPPTESDLTFLSSLSLACSLDCRLLQTYVVDSVS